MKYQETGRFGRITKNLRKEGFETEMESVLFDSSSFPKLTNKKKVRYVETVVDRMEEKIGTVNTKKVLSRCGVQCCGKSWSNFAKNIWNNSNSLKDFFNNLNKEEEKYNTIISFEKEKNTVYVMRTKCICGLINKGDISKENLFCSCSNGHMDAFFNSVFSVKNVELQQAIFTGADSCKWKVELYSWGDKKEK